VKFVCIDFETANSFIGSICSVGLAIIEDDKILETKSWLVKPHRDYSYFDPFNVMIHGITEKDIKDAPNFKDVYSQIKELLADSVLVAHNAAFDMSALRHVLDLYDIKYPEIDYVCTYKLATKFWIGLENYKLDTVSKHLNFEFSHHNAEEDAKACGNVLIHCMKEKNVNSITELSNCVGLKIGRLFAAGYTPCSVAKDKHGIDVKGIKAETYNFDPEHEFYNRKVVFTGTLSSMERKEAMQKVVNVGGLIGDSMTSDVNYLVMGMQDYSKFADGKESSKTKKAKQLIASGSELQIIDENEFLRLLQS